MSGHTIAITGANRGIGLEIARIFRERGDRVIGLCRRGSDGLREIGAEVVDGFDVASPEALAAAAPRVDAERIDVLVNDAGILSHQSFDQLGDAEARDAILEQYRVNALGPLLVTHALADRLGKGSKVALITSRMGSIGDNDSGGNYGYRMSKAALNAGGKSLALDLGQQGIAVGLFHPGFVRTEMTGGRGHVEPAEAAAMLVERIDALDADNAGRFLHANGEELPW
ncbi:MAG: SDR family oxidoreductase [Halofilum sp. (in: g-proteobacteria)]|nr:SDR family oxidoreductase [Halofilum sp. (in: g-proteobacteria)]